MRPEERHESKGHPQLMRKRILQRLFGDNGELFRPRAKRLRESATRQYVIRPMIGGNSLKSIRRFLTDGTRHPRQNAAFGFTRRAPHPARKGVAGFAPLFRS